MTSVLLVCKLLPVAGVTFVRCPLRPSRGGNHSSLTQPTSVHLSAALTAGTTARKGPCSETTGQGFCIRRPPRSSSHASCFRHTRIVLCTYHSYTFTDCLLSESTQFQTLSQKRTTVWNEVDRGVGESRGETHDDVRWNCAPETCVISLTTITLKNPI